MLTAHSCHVIDPPLLSLCILFLPIGTLDAHSGLHHGDLGTGVVSFGSWGRMFSSLQLYVFISYTQSPLKLPLGILDH